MDALSLRFVLEHTEAILNVLIKSLVRGEGKAVPLVPLMPIQQLLSGNSAQGLTLVVSEGHWAVVCEFVHGQSKYPIVLSFSGRTKTLAPVSSRTITLFP
jgi:hypothetical protein